MSGVPFRVRVWLLHRAVVELAAAVLEPVIAEHQGGNLIRSFGLHAGECVGVLLHRERRTLVAEPLADHLDRYACPQCDRGDEDLGNSSDPLTEIPQLSAEVVCC